MVQLSETNLKDSEVPWSGVVTAIEQHLRKPLSGVLQIEGGAVQGLIYICRGQLAYITHSIDPVSRLDLHLKSLNDRIFTLSADVRNQLRLTLDPAADLSIHLHADLQGIADLAQNHLLSQDAAQTLIEVLSREALESVLMLQGITASFTPVESSLDWIKPLNFPMILSSSIERLQAWNELRPHLWSPYQRPYLTNSNEHELTKLVLEGDGRLAKLLKGFTFRHLAILTYQDELEIARKILPFIQNKAIEVRPPQTPYHKLPTLLNLDQMLRLGKAYTTLDDVGTAFNAQLGPKTFAKPYRIACVDSSTIILQKVETFLEDDRLSLFLIQDTVKALVEVMDIKPDLILLDANLPGFGGYEVCRLLRKHPLFKSTPIIMLTGDTGLIDCAQASVAGATDFIMKPFTKPELSELVLKYLG